MTDYNAYIEKLPKAERPSVAVVKYHVDDSGRNAVAALVVVAVANFRVVETIYS